MSLARNEHLVAAAGKAGEIIIANFDFHKRVCEDKKKRHVLRKRIDFHRVLYWEKKNKFDLSGFKCKFKFSKTHYDSTLIIIVKIKGIFYTRCLGIFRKRRRVPLSGKS